MDSTLRTLNLSLFENFSAMWFLITIVVLLDHSVLHSSSKSYQRTSIWIFTLVFQDLWTTWATVSPKINLLTMILFYTKIIRTLDCMKVNSKMNLFKPQNNSVLKLISFKLVRFRSLYAFQKLLKYTLHLLKLI